MVGLRFPFLEINPYGIQDRDAEQKNAVLCQLKNFFLAPYLYSI